MVYEVGNIASLPVAMPRAAFPAVDGLAASVRPGVALAGVGSGVQAMVSGLHAQISQVKDSLAETALNIRGAQQGLDRAGELLNELDATLTGIVKQYPPFAQDNPQRVAYLNTITGLRKQLEALAFPPESPRAEIKLPANSGLDWALSALPQPARPEPGDLAIPELTPDATDAELVRMLGVVEVARDRVEALKTGMREDVVRFAASVDAPRALAQAGEIRAFVVALPDRGIGADAPRGVMTGGF